MGSPNGLPVGRQCVVALHAREHLLDLSGFWIQDREAPRPRFREPDTTRAVIDL